MKLLRSSALITLLALAMPGGSLWADRPDRGDQREHGGASWRSDDRHSRAGLDRMQAPRDYHIRGYTPDDRPRGYSTDLRYERSERSRYGGYRASEERHYDRDDRRYGRDDRRNDVYQRLNDGRRDDSGYHRRGGQRPVNDVIREVQDRYDGQVIGVQNSEGGSMYRVRVLQRDGRVKNVMVPAE